MSSGRAARVETNPEGGRDFVVRDVHEEFATLETMLTLLGIDCSASKVPSTEDLEVM